MSRKRNLEQSRLRAVIESEVREGLANEINREICYDDGWPYPHLYTHKDQSGQVVQMMFFMDNDNPETTLKRDKTWWVTLYIGDRRLKNLNVDGLSTGKIGIRGLMIAKQMLIHFIINEMNFGQRIVVHPYDSKRRRVYSAVLEKMGFKRSRHKKLDCYVLKRDW